MNKNQKKIVTIISMFLLIAIIFMAGHFAVSRYLDGQKLQLLQQQNLERELSDTRSILTAQNQAIADAKRKITQTQSELDSIKNKPAPIVSVSSTTSKQTDLSSIIIKWRPSVAYVKCTFQLNGRPYIEQSGTGVLFDMHNPQTGSNYYKIMTNRHVVLWDNDGVSVSPSSCLVKFPDNRFSYSFNFDQQNQDPNNESTWNIAGNLYGYDIAYIYLKSPNEYVKSIAAQNDLWCGDGDLQGKVGDSLVILGYPAIGSKTDITATDGIISGVDGDYFITSAKVEHGNSGGAAISLRGNCFLGIPTWSDVGEAESLARILRVDVIEK